MSFSVAQYTLPIYEAVVCNLIIERLQREEIDEKLLTTILKSLTLGKSVVRQLTESDLSTISLETISPVYIALSVMVRTRREAIESMQSLLPQASEKYRPAIAETLEDIEKNTDRIEEIAEAWAIPFEQNTMQEIKQALDNTRTSNSREAQDWRQVLAELSN